MAPAPTAKTSGIAPLLRKTRSRRPGNFRTTLPITVSAVLRCHSAILPLMRLMFAHVPSCAS